MGISVGAFRSKLRYLLSSSVVVTRSARPSAPVIARESQLPRRGSQSDTDLQRSKPLSSSCGVETACACISMSMVPMALLRRVPCPRMCYACLCISL